jgi:YD repeat-containing protein
MTSRRAPGGGTTTNVFNPDMTRASTVLPTGEMIRFEYDPLKRLAREVFSGDASRRFAHDARDRVTEITDELGKKTTFGYDGNGRRIAITDALGNATRFGYDGNDRLISRTDPLGKVTRYSYDRVGRIESVTGPTGVSVRLSRDRLGRIREVFDAAGKLFTLEYNLEGIPVSVVDGTGLVYRFTTDLARALTALVDPAGNSTQYARDVMGRVTSVTDPLGEAVQRVYDAAGRLTQTRYADGTAMGRSYSADSMPAADTDERGGVLRREYDVARRVVSVTDQAGLITRYSYGPRGQVSRITRPDSSTVDFTYDAANRLIRRTYSDGTVMEFVRDDLGRIIRGPGLTLAYDAAGRVIESNGIRTSYDNSGRVVSVTYGPDRVVRYEYNNRGKVSKITDWKEGVSEYDYDAALRVAGIRRSSGVNSSFGYGQDGRLATVSHTGADWQASGALVRDKEGHIVSIDRNISGIEVPAVNFSGKAEEYAYTANNRVEGREYDGRGNVVRSGGLTFVWDGRNLARTISAAADSVSMEWDAFGRLIRIGPKRMIWNYAVNPPALATIIEETPPAGAAGARRYLKWHSNSGPPGDYVEYPTPAGDEQRLIGESVSSVLRLLPLMLMYFELGGKAEFHEAGPRRESLLCLPFLPRSRWLRIMVRSIAVPSRGTSTFLSTPPPSSPKVLSSIPTAESSVLQTRRISMFLTHGTSRKPAMTKTVQAAWRTLVIATAEVSAWKRNATAA